MADAHGSGPCVRKDVGVQLPPCPPTKARNSGPSVIFGARIGAWWCTSGARRRFEEAPSMAWIETKARTDGGTSCIVRWRLGGTRTGKPQNETCSAGSDEQNAARAEGFKQMVMAAGESWPDGWIKGRGFVRESGLAQDVPAPARTFHDVGLDYVNQIVGCSPGQRARYRSQIRLLDTLEVKGASGL